MIRFSDKFSDKYFAGIASEVFDNKTKRYRKKHVGIRNEPLDTLVYAYAATYHQLIRANLKTPEEWALIEESIAKSATIATPGKISLTNWARG